MSSYIIEGKGIGYFIGYSAGVVHFGTRAEAVTFPTAKEAENYITALRKGGFHTPMCAVHSV